MYEQNLTSMSKDFVRRVKKYLGDSPDSPNWFHMDEITVGIAGKKDFKVLIFQGDKTWVIGSIDI